METPQPPRPPNMGSSDSGSILDALVLSHGFRNTPNGNLGLRENLPVRVAEDRNAQRNNIKVLRVVVGTASNEAAAAAQAAVHDQRKELPAKPLFNEAVDGGLVVDFKRKLVKGPANEALAAIDAVLRIVASIPGATPSRRDGAELTVVDGVPRLLTADERESLLAEARAAAEAYEQMDANVPAGLVGALIGAAVTAGVWAALIRFAEVQHWAVAIGGGFLIGWLAMKMGRKAVLPLQIAVPVLTVLAVVVGDILGIALIGQDIMGQFDLGAAFELYKELWSEDTFTPLFSLGGGLVGAFFALQNTRKPTFERQIDVH